MFRLTVFCVPLCSVTQNNEMVFLCEIFFSLTLVTTNMISPLSGRNMIWQRKTVEIWKKRKYEMRHFSALSTISICIV